MGEGYHSLVEEIHLEEVRSFAVYHLEVGGFHLVGEGYHSLGEEIHSFAVYHLEVGGFHLVEEGYHSLVAVNHFEVVMLTQGQH